MKKSIIAEGNKLKAVFTPDGKIERIVYIILHPITNYRLWKNRLKVGDTISSGTNIYKIEEIRDDSDGITVEVSNV